MREMKKSSVWYLYLTIILLVQMVSPFITVADVSAATSGIKENVVHTYSQNTWAWNSLATGPNGETYLTHKVSSTEIAVKKWNGNAWDSLPSVTTALTGDTTFNDSLDLAVDGSGNLHLVYKHAIGDSMTSKRGVKYGVFNGTSWSFSEVEAYSHPYGWKNFYDPALALDSNGKAHIVYKYAEAETHTSYIHYATNKSGSWQISRIATGLGGTDEVHKPSVQVNKQNDIHLSYVKEDNQNSYYGNFYYTKKALGDANFPAVQKLIDAVSEGKSYRYSPLTVDEAGKGYFTYKVNGIGSPSYLHSSASGSWTRSELYTDAVRNTTPLGVYAVGSTLYVLMDSRAATATENHLFAMANYGDGWITGTKTVNPELVNDNPNELTYQVDADGNFMLAMLHGTLREIVSLTGTSDDFGLVPVSQTTEAPTVTGATTMEDTQTNSGLMITRNAQDSDVPFFKIDSITGGNLYKNDGTTAIANGSFITSAEAAAGLKFTPAPDANSASGGTFQFNVYASLDATGKGLSSATVATITVSEVNDAPIAGNDVLASVGENTTTTLTTPIGNLLGNDLAGPANESGQTLSVVSVQNVKGGTVSISGTDIVFSLKKDYSGTAGYDYTIQDNGTTAGTSDPQSDTATVSFTVTPNQAPTVANPIADQTATVGKELIINVTNTFNDADSDVLALTATVDPAGATAVVEGGQLKISSTSTGKVTISLSANDGRGKTVTETFDVTITNSNPTAGNVTSNTIENISVSGQVSGTDSDGHIISYQLGENPDHGTATVTKQGQWQYIPTQDFFGTDSFTVTLTDGYGGQSSATVNITVNELEKYNVLFEMNGGNPVSPQLIKQGKLASKPSTPQRVGYTFDNWYGDAGFISAFDFTTPIVQETTIYAKWTLNEYQISFDGQGGTTVANQTVAHFAKVTEPAEPTKVGHTFSGWYNGNEAYDFNTQVTGPLMLTAKWTINQYEVTFNTNDGTTVDTQTIDYNKLATEPTAPTRVGYTFEGWYSDSGLTNAFDFAQPIIQDITLHAKWTLNEYVILFDEQGGSNVENQTVAHFAKVADPGEPTKVGYTFSGWYYGDTAYDFDTEVTGSLTLTAKWTINQYEVTFDSNEGTLVDAQTVNYNELAKEPTAPTRTGYTFAGWYVDDELVDAFDFTQPIAQDTTLYAKWTLNQYQISFDEQGGTEVADQTVAHFAKVTIPAETTKEGYTFSGWYAGNAAYDFDSEVTGPLTLTAKWTINQYEVTFDSNEGTTVDSQTIDYNEFLLEPTAPTRTGYTFTGWYTEETLENKWNFAVNTVKKDIVLHAGWTINSYTLTFVSNRGSDVDPVTVEYLSKVTEPEDPTRVGYSFMGWYVDEQFNNLYDFNIPMTKDLSVYARWTFTYVPPGPQMEEIDVDVVSGDNVIVRTKITRTTESDGKVKDSLTVTPEKADELVTKLINSTNKNVKFIIQDKQDQVSETSIQLPKQSLTAFGNGKTSFEVFTENVRLFLPLNSIGNFKEDLYFRVVPVNDVVTQGQLLERAKQEKLVRDIAGNKLSAIEVLGRPVKIESNMQNRPVILTLPIEKALLANGKNRDELLKNLVIFIEHSDGTKETLQGKVVEFTDGNLGIEFVTNKFSNFTMLYMPGAAAYFAENDSTMHKAYIHGFEDGTFRPDNTVNRAQMAAMLVRNLDITYTGTTSYKDTKGSFAFKEIEMAREAGIIMGYTDGTFKPGKAITRAQMATIASRWITNECKTDMSASFCQSIKPAVDYKDVSSDYWATAAIEHVTKTGIMQGFTGGAFHPEQALTRAQAVVVLNRLFGRTALNGATNPSFKDVPVDYWAYEAIEEASNDHLLSLHGK